MKHLQKLTVVFSIMVVLFGFYQLSYEQDIFAQSLKPCCSQGQCRVGCNVQTYVEAGSLCNIYLLTCKDCIDLEYSGCLDNCQNKTNDYCYYNGVKYYGSEVLCLEQK